MVHRESELCKVKSAFYDDVLEAVIQSLKMRIADFEFQMTNDEIKRQAEQQVQIIESLEKELSTQEAKRIQLFEYLESGIYTKEEFMERKDVITERIEKLKDNIQTEREKSSSDVDYEEHIYKFSEVVTALCNPDVPGKHKNDLLKEIISRIEYDCEDLGKGKGGNVILDIHFKNQY